MQILKPGLPSDRPRHFRTTCSCTCEFQFSTLSSGVSLEHKGPCDDWLFVNCPSCNTRMQFRLPHAPLVETVAPATAKVAHHSV